VTNVISGINEQLSSNLMVYPNPFSQNTTIRLLNKKDELLDLSLFDSTGKKVKGLNYYTKDNTITIERGNLTKGIYLLVVKTRNYTSKSKLVID
ncbi:MAG: T9SS type A sorting domain-containing protein, partial [Flavobacteriales bacterium]|nr:T9SS type A sorting domain-containing protein [Flavobacteriales bacterium]